MFQEAGLDGTTGREWPRVAVVGCGYWGKNLVRNFAELGVLSGLVDHHAELVAMLSAKHGGAVMGFDDVLSNEAIGAVAIVTPGPSHFDLARQALEAGKHVYVEKPMTMSAVEARQLAAIAATGKRTLMGGHILRYHAAFERLAELAMAGEIGTLRHVISERLNLGKILKDEDAIWALAPHDLSMILALMGREPETVHCTGDALLRPGITDLATLRLTYAGNRSAEIRLSWMAPIKQQRLTVMGEQGMLVFDDTRGWSEKLTLFKPGLNWVDPAVQPDPGTPVFVDIPQSEPLKAECRHFLDCAVNGSEPRTDGAESAAVLALIERAQASLKAGGSPR